MLLHVLEVITMGVPKPVGNRHAAGPRFNKPTGHKKLIVPKRAAIAQMLA